MEDFETKLREYRRKKQRELRYARFRQYLQGFLQFGIKKNEAGEQSDDQNATNSRLQLNTTDNQDFVGNVVDPRVIHQFQHPELRWSEDENSASSLIFSDVIEEEGLESSKPAQNPLLKYSFYCVFLLFWVTLYRIAIELEFGIVFLICSALCGIYFNTRTGPKRPDEVSAYSVFNKNCRSIHGTLKAEQFERELGIR